MWHSTTHSAPPEDQLLLTKIVDKKGTRNEQMLRYSSGNWWIPGHSVPILYTPTHWTKDFNPAHYREEYV